MKLRSASARSADGGEVRGVAIQITLDDLIAQADERERLQANQISKTRGYRCECGAWSYDQRKVKVCGLCGRRFTISK